uniref:Headcase protein-like n=1 Tax=Drosophila rhopaloa TaxID=1041015 RepID=A0A6P4FT10_DRORH
MRPRWSRPCSSIAKQPAKQQLYNAAIDYSAPLQQQINPDLIGAHPHAQQHQQQKGLEGLLLTNSNTSNSSSSSISNLIISHNSASNPGSKIQPNWGQSDAISALWGCSSSSSGCSSGSGSQPSLSPTASSHGNDNSSKMMLWATQTSLTSSSSSSNGWSASHYGKQPNIWELPGSAGQRTPASSHDIFTDLLCNLSISQDNSSQQAKTADASDVSSNSSSSAGELLDAANIWRFPEYANQIYPEEPTGGAAACMQLFNDYLNMN